MNSCFQGLDTARLERRLAHKLQEIDSCHLEMQHIADSRFLHHEYFFVDFDLRRGKNAFRRVHSYQLRKLMLTA